MVRYLKEEKLLKKDFEHSVDNITSDCDQLVEQYKKAKLISWGQNFRDNENLLSDPDCIVEQLKAINYIDAVMLDEVYRSEKNTAKSISNFPGFVDNDAGIKRKLQDTIKGCDNSEEFGSMFDILYSVNFSPNKESTADKIETLCSKEHLIDNNFLSTETYNITLNPENVDVVNVDCTQIMGSLKGNTIEKFAKIFSRKYNLASDKMRTCSLDVLRSSSFFESVIKIWILKRIKISEADKAAERNVFIKHLTPVIRRINKCLK